MGSFVPWSVLSLLAGQKRHGRHHALGKRRPPSVAAAIVDGVKRIL